MIVQKLAKRSSHAKTSWLRRDVLIALSLLVAGCSGTGPRVSLPNLPNLPDLSLTPNSDSFRKRFYAGVGIGSNMLSPDTSDAPVFSADDTAATASQLRVGYDLHNRLAMEFDSSVLGEAAVNETNTASMKYSSLGASALYYALGAAENRNRRQRWTGYGRLGVALNRTASNIEPLDRSDTALIAGLGTEYGMKNGLGIRAEVTRFDAESTYVGLGAVFRFNSVKRFIPPNLDAKKNAKATVSNRFGGPESDSVASPSYGEEPALGAAMGPAMGPAQVRQSGDYRVGKVTLLASANDLDADGVANAEDECKDTQPKTEVNISGCGLFDAVLANGTFNSGSAGLNENTKASLDNLVTRLVAFPEVRIAIEGHTDDKGPDDINMNVSRSRAQMVRNYLIKKGIPPQQLEIRAHGETKPVADNDTAAGRDQNRRIAFVTLPNLSAEQISSPETAELSSPPPGGAGQDAATQLAKSDAESADEPDLAAARDGIDLLPATFNIPGLNAHRVMENVGFVEKTANLTPKSNQTLREVAQVLKNQPGTKVLLAAHTNLHDSDEENRTLSDAQAQSVVRALVSHGVNRRQLVGQGFGNSLPLAQEVTDADKAVNRRVELRPIRN